MSLPFLIDPPAPLNAGFGIDCEIAVATDGPDTVAKAIAFQPDLVVLNITMPKLSGFEVCRKLKADPKTQEIPVVMLTAKGGEADIVAGLELGADDYVTKPFSPRVLTARVKAVLRREQNEGDAGQSSIKIRELVLHPGRHQVLVQDRPVDLTASEFRILLFMARKPGWVFTRQQIVDAAQGDDVYVNERFVTDRSVDVHIVSLRPKLGACGGYIDTVRGVGYRLKDE